MTLAAAARIPTGPAFTVVLVVHVAAVLVTLLAGVAGAVSAARVLTVRGELPRSVRSYFRPGVNWVGRALYLVPVTGAALLAMSGGSYRFGAAWVDWGLGLWAASAVLAEALLWPAERRAQRGLSAAPAGELGVPAPAGELGVPAPVRRACRTMCLATAAVVAVVVAAMVVMFAKP